MKVFILHGWTYELDKWDVFLAELKRRGVETVQLKVPGLTEQSDKAWDINDYIEWLDSKLQGESAPIVLGHSNGGRIALAYAQEYPHKIKQLILLDSAGVPQNSRGKNIKRVALKAAAKTGKILTPIP